MQRRHFRFAGLALGGALLFPAVARAADDGSSATTSPADAAPAAGTETGRFRLEPAMGVKSGALLGGKVRASTFIEGDLAFRFGTSSYRPSIGISAGSIVYDGGATATTLVDLCPIGFRFAAERVRLSTCARGGAGTSGSSDALGPSFSYGADLRGRFYVGTLKPPSSIAFYADVGLGLLWTKTVLTDPPSVSSGESSTASSYAYFPVAMSWFTAAFAFGVEFR